MAFLMQLQKAAWSAMKTLPPQRTQSLPNELPSPTSTLIGRYYFVHHAVAFLKIRRGYYFLVIHSSFASVHL